MTYARSPVIIFPDGKIGFPSAAMGAVMFEVWRTLEITMKSEDSA